MNFLVSLLEDADFRVDPTSFVEHLRTEWAEVQIRSVADPKRHYLLEWALTIRYRLDGALDRTLKVISLEGDLEDCAKFALWYRKFVPSEYGLLFFDQGYHAHVNLHNETTEQQIVDAFTAENSSSE